jgi:hypothetical protein
MELEGGIEAESCAVADFVITLRTNGIVILLIMNDYKHQDWKHCNP